MDQQLLGTNRRVFYILNRFPEPVRHYLQLPIILLRYLFGFDHWFSLGASKSALASAPQPSPEQLLHERLNAGDFEAALQLAIEYNLNTDLVYELQWANSSVDQQSIESFLAQVQDTHWALDQCTARLGDDVFSNQCLLDHGLQLTELRYVLPSDPNDISVDDLHELPYQEYTKQVQQRIDEKKRRLLSEVIEQPTARQQFLLTARLKLLRHKQLLLLYEQIQTDQHLQFDANDYDRFRSRPLLQSAIEFATEGQWKALRILFTYAGNDLLPHRLVILSHVPETISPFVYQTLLPQCPPGPDDLISYPWEQAQLLKIDWAHENFKSIDPAIISEIEFESQLYAEQPELLQFKCDAVPSKNELSIWYRWRARQIEFLTGIVCNALALLAVGIRQNVPELESLRDDLHTFETLVYDLFSVRPNLNHSLEQFERLSIQDKLDLLMTGSSDQPQQFLRAIQQKLIPFLNRYAPNNYRMQEKLLQDFLMSCAVHNIELLAFYLKQLQQLPPSESNHLLKNGPLLATVVMSALYADLNCEQLLLAQQILQSIKSILKNDSKVDQDSQSIDIDQLKAKLKASRLLQKHNHFMNPRQLKELNESASLLDRVKHLFSTIIKKSINIRRVTRSQWIDMISDLQDIRVLLFDNLLKPTELLELCVRTLLTSNFQANIDLACEMFDFGQKNHFELNQNAEDGWELDSSVDESVDESLECNHLIPEETAISMLVTAAVDFLCAADSIRDRSAELGTHCLRKIPATFHQREDVQAEFDFLAALKLLHEHFDIRLLPVQLRLMPYPKLDAIRAAASSIPKGHRRLDVLLQLAKLLRVFEGRADDYRDTHVLLLSGDLAFDCGDYSHCVNCCRLMISRKLYAGWKLCQRLGSCDQFDDLLTRHQLLSFAVSNCDEDGAQLQLLLDQLRRLKLQLNQKSTDQGVSRLLANKTAHVSGHIREKTQHVAKATGQLAGWLLRNLMPGELNESEHEQLEQLAAEQEYESRISLKHGDQRPQFTNSLFIAPFYESAFYSLHRLVQLQSNDGYWSGDFYLPEVTNELEAPTSDKSRPLPVAQLLLRTSMLNETGTCRNRVETLLRQLARSALQHDTMLAISYLFTVSDVRRAQTVFTPLAQCPELLLSIAEYCVCVRLGQHQQHPMSLHQFTIDEAIRRGRCCISNESNTKFERDCRVLLQQYSNRRQMVHKADRVRSLCSDISTQRFLKDSAYRHETLLGLALTDCQTTLASVVELALEFHVPLFDVYLAHTEHLMTDAQIPVSQLQTRIFDNLELFSALLEQNEATTDAFERRVRPLLSGTDYERLSVYFEVLRRINTDDVEKSSEFERHLRNLQAIARLLQSPMPEVSSTRLDYLRLIDNRKAPFETVFAILDESNHLRVAKCLQTLEIDPPLTSSAVHSLWLRKLLLSESSSCWTRSLFISIWPTVRRLQSTDLRLFATFFALSPEADRRQLALEDRKYALGQMIRQANRKCEKSDDSDAQRAEWIECCSQLNHAFESLSKSSE